MLVADDRLASLDLAEQHDGRNAIRRLLSAFAALPVLGIGLPYTDAYFETMSGLTTTGATVIAKLDSLPRGLLLWRAILNGGCGPRGIPRPH